MATWRIYYDSGETYSDEDGPLESAPCDGVIVVVQVDRDVGREILHLKDFYYWEHRRWWGCDAYGRDDYLRRAGWKKLVAGRNTDYANYSALFDRAMRDPDFPSKSARLVCELPKR